MRKRNTLSPKQIREALMNRLPGRTVEDINEVVRACELELQKANALTDAKEWNATMSDIIDGRIKVSTKELMAMVEDVRKGDRPVLTYDTDLADWDLFRKTKAGAK